MYRRGLSLLFKHQLGYGPDLCETLVQETLMKNVDDNNKNKIILRGEPKITFSSLVER